MKQTSLEGRKKQYGRDVNTNFRTRHYHKLWTHLHTLKVQRRCFCQKCHCRISCCCWRLRREQGHLVKNQEL